MEHEQSTQFATFFLNGLHFGVEVRQVQEVIRFQQMTRVPLAPPVIEGLINLRGQIVTALDLRKRIGLPARPAEDLPMNVVVRTDDGPLSLLVDEIGDVVDVGNEAFEPVPETVVGEAAQLVSGVYKLRERLLLVLDVTRAIDVRNVARPAGAKTVVI
jgi:purine-binding chemotaxis protein CheW